MVRIYDNVQYQLQCENQFFFKQFYYYHCSNNIRLPILLKSRLIKLRMVFKMTVKSSHAIAFVVGNYYSTKKALVYVKVTMCLVVLFLSPFAGKFKLVSL